MKKKMFADSGFTLIEVIVVIGILTILTGIIIPMVYRVWESQEVDTTRERMTRLKEAMAGNISQTSNGSRSDFGFVGDLGQLPPDLDALISYTSAAGTFGPYLSGGFDPVEFKQDAWWNNFIYNVTTDGFGRRESAVITSLGSDNAVGGSGTAADLQLAIDANEVLPAASLSCNVLVRFLTAPVTTFNAVIAVYIKYKNGEGLDVQQSFSSPVTITGNAGSPENNYSFGLNSGLAQKVPVGVASVWASIDRDSSGNPLVPPVTGPVSYVTVNDRVSTLFANGISISVP